MRGATRRGGAEKSKPPPRRGWGAVSNCAAFDRRLTDACCRVYMSLCSWGGEDKRAYAAVNTIAELTNLGESTVKRSIAKLIECGYISETSNPHSKTGRTIHIEMPPVFVREEEKATASDGAADIGETDKRSSVNTGVDDGVHQRAPGGSPAGPHPPASGPPGGSPAGPKEEPSDKNPEEKNPSEQEPPESITLTLGEHVADDRAIRNELGAMIDEVPALRNATGKRRGEWVDRAARWLADVYSDERSLNRYRKALWRVARGERDAAEILRAFDTVDADGESGKLRGGQGPYFFGVLETGYDGDRRLADESEAQTDAGLSKPPPRNWDDPHEPTDAERAAMTRIEGGLLRSDKVSRPGP